MYTTTQAAALQARLMQATPVQATAVVPADEMNDSMGVQATAQLNKRKRETEPDFP